MPVRAVGRYRGAARFLREQSAPIVFAGDYLPTAMIEGAWRTTICAADILKGGA
jgi:hypothetical protein